MTFRDAYVAARCAEIQNLLDNAARWSSTDEELGAHLAAYISVLLLGVIEDCTEHLIAQRVARTKDAHVHHYVCLVLDQRFRNPDHGAISGLLKEFGDDYQTLFKDKFPHTGKEAEALQAIVDNKNSLAHVGTRKLEMTLADVADYCGRIVPILEGLEQILA